MINAPYDETQKSAAAQSRVPGAGVGRALLSSFRCSALALAALLVGSPLAEARPVNAPAPVSMQEEVLGREGGVVRSVYPLSREAMWRLVEAGADELVLMLAKEAMEKETERAAVRAWLPLAAAAHLAAGRTLEAKKVLEGLSPQEIEADPRVNMLLADTYFIAGEHGEARRQYANFLYRHPQDPRRFRAQRRAGISALREGLLDEAALSLRLYDEEMDRPYPDAELRLALMELYQKQGLSDLARDMRDSLLALGLASPEARKLLMDTLEEAKGAGRWGDVAGYYQELLSAGGLTPRELRAARLGLIEAWEALGRWEEAILLLEEVMDKDQSADLPVLLTRLYMRWPLGNQSGTTGPHNQEQVEAVRQRHRLIQALAKSSQASEQESLLEELLDNRDALMAGRLRQGGPLTPGALGISQLSDAMRLLYADSYRRLGLLPEAADMVKDYGGKKADLLPILLPVAAGKGDKGQWDALLRQLPDSAQEWSCPLRRAVAQSLLLAEEKGHGALAAQLTGELAAMGESPVLTRITAFHEAAVSQREGRLQEALPVYLQLALVKGECPDDLPEDPLRGAVKVLNALGRGAEATLLQELTQDRAPGKHTPLRKPR